PDHRAVALEDVREAGGDDRIEAVILQRPGRVLARRARPEVRPGREDRGALELRAVEREVRLLDPVVEQALAKPGALDPLQEQLGDDLVGVDVGPVEGGDGAGDDAHRLHATSSRTSVRWPVTAAAAAIAGETRCVRPPRPWRPSKLRLEVDAHRSPGTSLSGFMARHIEQPGSRQSNPAARKILSRPSASAWVLTACEPGTTSVRMPLATCRPSATGEV